MIATSVLLNIVGSLAQPIFAAGKIRSDVRLAVAQQQEAVLWFNSFEPRAAAGKSSDLRQKINYSSQSPNPLDTASSSMRFFHPCVV